MPDRNSQRTRRPARHPAFLALLALLGLLALPGSLPAQGWIEPAPGIDGVAKLRTRVVATVRGQVATVEVEEWFANRGPRVAEGHYLYPLPGEAVFTSFSLYQGDRELRGETMDADEARGIYRSIVRRRKDPALIELAGHGLLRARVFPIGAGQTRRITLRYTQLLDRAGDAHRFRWVAGSGTHAFPRPAPRLLGIPRRPPRVPDSVAPRPTVLHREPAGGGVAPRSAPVDFRVVVDDGAAYREPFSPTHRVESTREGGRLVVRPVSELAGDFTLFLPFAGERVGITLATHRVSGEDGYFMLTLSPEDAVGDAEPRDVTAVVDVSGSMSGEKLAQAKSALRQLLGTLGPGDRFRLVAFSNGVRAYRAGWTVADDGRLRDAGGWIDGLEADGGTNIAGALEEAFRARTPDGRLPLVIFLTDGLPTVGERDPERIAARVESTRGEARIFAFGVGYDVNTLLLDRLGAAGRGSTGYVEPGESVEAALSSLARKIHHPVLTGIEIVASPVELLDLHPRRLPDLFAGEELVVFGRYRLEGGGREGTVRIAGERRGRTEAYGVAARFPEREAEGAFIPRLWASRKLGALTRTLRLEGPDPELEEEIRRTALRYGLVTERTAYLVLEPGAMAGGRRPRDVPVGALRQGALAPSGKVAVEVSEEARRRRELRTAAELAEAEADLLAAAVGTETVVEADRRRVVAGRVFREVDGAWIDGNHREDVPVVEVAPYGDAWFDLLERLPELERYWTRFERVLVAGESVSVRVAPGGVETLSPGALDDLVKRFRSG